MTGDVMYYLLMLAGVMILAVNFSFQKLYQKHVGSSVVKGLFFNALNGIETTVVFFFVHLGLFGIEGFNFSPFAIICASIMSIFCFLYVILGFKMMKKGPMTNYTLFLMSGGMIIPYLFGIIFLGEFQSLTGWQIALRILGLVLVVLGVVVSNRTKEKSTNVKAIILLGSLIFLFNGLVSVASKVHQLPEFTEIATATTGFVFIQGLAQAVLCSASLLVIGPKHKEELKAIPKFKALGFSSGNAIGSGIYVVIQLLCASKLPASVLFPMITGGTIIFSALAGRLAFREKIAKNTLTGIILCFVGTLLFL